MPEERPKEQPKKKRATEELGAEITPDFDVHIPDGTSKADFHQNLFKTVSTASTRRKRGGKPAASTKNQLGISAIFKQDPPSQPAPKSPIKTSAKKQQLRTSPRRMSPAKHDFKMDFSDDTLSDVQMAEPPLEPADARSVERTDEPTKKTQLKAASKSLSKYTSSVALFDFLVTESTSPGTTVKKSVSALKKAPQKTLSFSSK